MILVFTVASGSRLHHETMIQADAEQRAHDLERATDAEGISLGFHPKITAYEYEPTDHRKPKRKTR